MASQSFAISFGGSAWRSRIIDALREYTFMFALVLTVALVIANVIVLPAFANWSEVPDELGTLAPFALAAMAGAPAILSGGGGIDLSIAPLMGLVNIVLVTGLSRKRTRKPADRHPGPVPARRPGRRHQRGAGRDPPLPAGNRDAGRLLHPRRHQPSAQAGPRQHEPELDEPARLDLWHIPGTVFTVGSVLLFWFFFRRSALYGALFAVGDDDVAAYGAGVDVAAVRILAYALGGVVAAVGGIALTGTIQSADVTVWPSYVLIALAAVALGGTADGGGRGGFLGPALGATAVYLIQNLLSALGIDVFYVQVSVRRGAAVRRRRRLLPQRVGKGFPCRCRMTRIQARRVVAQGQEIQRRFPMLQIVALVALFAWGTVSLPAFAQRSSIDSMLVRSHSSLGIAAAGQTIVILIGGIDLSVPFDHLRREPDGHRTGRATAGRSHAVALVILAGAAVAGVVNGFVSHHYRVPPLIITLATGSIVAGAVLAGTKGARLRWGAAVADPVRLPGRQGRRHPGAPPIAASARLPPSSSAWYCT